MMQSEAPRRDWQPIRCGRVDVAFDAAHRVLRHESKCAHLHGHRYRVEVEAEAPALDDVGRVVDFADLKEIAKGFADRYLDHGTLVNPRDFELLDWLGRHNQKHFVMPSGCDEPTAENLARTLASVLGEQLRARQAGLELVRVRVYETVNCYAEIAR